jgi:hypothetical protein
MRYIGRSVGLAASAMVLFAGGCADPDGGRCEVVGTVKLKGELVKEGVIEFTPMDKAPEGMKATKSGAVISNGEYKIPKAQGLIPGRYRVVITSGDGVTPANPDEPPGPSGSNIVSKDRIPAEYNAASKQEVEVKKEGPNRFDYDIR